MAQMVKKVQSQCHKAYLSPISTSNTPCRWCVGEGDPRAVDLEAAEAISDLGRDDGVSWRGG